LLATAQDVFVEIQGNDSNIFPENPLGRGNRNVEVSRDLSDGIKRLGLFAPVLSRCVS